MFADFLESRNWRNEIIDNQAPILKKTYIPLGPVAVFGASNFPLAYSTAGGDTTSALAAGCPVIVKSHPMHAATNDLVAQAILRAVKNTNMPDGVFSSLNGISHQTGQALVLHRHIKAVGFTGSVQGGRALMDLAAGREEPIPVFAEMGSVNPVVISNLSLERKALFWAKAYADSISQGGGQFCTSPGIIIAEKNKHFDNFARLLSTELNKIETACMLHPNIKKQFINKRDHIIALDSVRSLSKIKKEHDNYIQQSVVIVDGNSFLKNKALREEVFGSFCVLVECKDQYEILDIIESLEGQLTGTIIAEKEEDIQDLKEVFQYRVGRLILNGVSTGVRVCKAMHHGGPYPASSTPFFTAVGTDAIKRWIRPITYQNFY